MKGKTHKMDSESIQEQIHKYIQEDLNDGVAFDRGENLIRQGLIDSMGVMKLTIFLEKRFGVEIELEDITAENFETLSRISELIACTQEKRPE